MATTGNETARKVCIVGGVAGGASAAARLRRLNEHAEILVFEKDEYISFANCGLPYHISGTIKERKNLILQTPETFKQRFNIDVRTQNRVTRIDRRKKQLLIKDLKTGREYTESYDKLVLAPGAVPFVPPIKGNQADNFMTLRNIPDMDRIIAYIHRHNIKKAIVIGGGFIGVEVAENLQESGIKVNLVEMADQVITPLDREMANILHAKLKENGVSLQLQSTVTEVSPLGVTLADGKVIEGELVISAIGVRPENHLAKEAGLTLGATGGILVDEHMRTSDENIYAVGDAVEINHFITGKPALIPLAGPANKQGRIAADNIMGLASRYADTQGTGILKVYNLQAAFTGINEKLAKQSGYNYKAIHIHAMSHAGYYPGAYEISLKIIFEKNSGKLLGAQAVGPDGVDKRIDVLATAIRAGLTVRDLTELELAYAPPYGSAKDPINMAGYVGENILDGLVTSITWDKVEQLDNPLIVDLRTSLETGMGKIPGAVCIPVDELRQRLDELPRHRNLVLVCKVGIRGHIAYRILKQHGFNRVYNLSGGYNSYTNYTSDTRTTESIPGNSGLGDESSRLHESELDLRGLQCPGPIVQLAQHVDRLQVGESVSMLASDPGFAKDLPAFCRARHCRLLTQETRGSDYFAVIRKEPQTTAESQITPVLRKKSLIVFSGELDRAMAAFIIANGARAMGSEVTLFFTFWGLNILRKPEKVRVKKSLVEKMFAFMMPRGVGKLKLSKMHFGGLGTKMMRWTMAGKNVDSIESLVRQAIQNGVKLVACTMSMDVMGIRKEELIDGIEYAGVAHYLQEADESNQSFMI
jgi:NADPH-dependent 2,4-dienoyl-CoA reductase/sulfur reductase-like enzyme/peroxiredoxin family protein/rhodanese-related sulfurtransferase/TusA-related sulfurtransferase